MSQSVQSGELPKPDEMERFITRTFCGTPVLAGGGWRTPIVVESPGGTLTAEADLPALQSDEPEAAT
jgi:hypothetical protein